MRTGRCLASRSSASRFVGRRYRRWADISAMGFRLELLPGASMRIDGCAGRGGLRSRAAYRHQCRFFEARDRVRRSARARQARELAIAVVTAATSTRARVARVGLATFRKTSRLRGGSTAQSASRRGGRYSGPCLRDGAAAAGEGAPRRRARLGRARTVVLPARRGRGPRGARRGRRQCSAPGGGFLIGDHVLGRQHRDQLLRSRITTACRSGKKPANAGKRTHRSPSGGVTETRERGQD